MLRSKLRCAWRLCKDLSAKQVPEIVDENFLKVSLSPRAAAAICRSLVVQRRSMIYEEGAENTCINHEFKRRLRLERVKMLWSRACVGSTETEQ